MILDWFYLCVPYITYTLMYAAAITSLMVNLSGVALCKLRNRFNMSVDSVGFA